MTKAEAIAGFDPNGPGNHGSIFGLPFTPDNAELVIVPVPWEVTVSYHSGTAQGPRAVFDASSQVDLSIKDIPGAWKLGIGILDIPQTLQEESAKLRELATKHIRAVENGEHISADNP